MNEKEYCISCGDDKAGEGRGAYCVKCYDDIDAGILKEPEESEL